MAFCTILLKSKVTLYNSRRLVLSIVVVILLGSCRSIESDEQLQLLTPEKNLYSHATWSPDGRELLYQPGVGAPLVALDVTQGERRTLPVPPEGIYNVDWFLASDVAFTRYLDKSGTSAEFVVASVETGEEKILITEVTVLDFCWNTALDAFAIVVQEPGLSFPVLKGNVLRKYDPDGGQASLLFRTRADNSIWDISCHDGSGAIAVVERGDDKSVLYTIVMPEGTPRKIFESSRMDFDSPTWSPDGHWLALRSLEGTSKAPLRGLFLLSSDGTETRRIDLPVPEDALINMTWSPVDNNKMVIRLLDGFGLFPYQLYLLDMPSWIEEASTD